MYAGGLSIFPDARSRSNDLGATVQAPGHKNNGTGLADYFAAGLNQAGLRHAVHEPQIELNRGDVGASTRLPSFHAERLVHNIPHELRRSG